MIMIPVALLWNRTARDAIAVSLSLALISGCALGGMGKDGRVDQTAPLEKRQKGVDSLMKDVRSETEKRQARGAELLPRYGSLSIPLLVEMAGSGGLDDRLRAISILSDLGAEGREALPFLIDTLDDDDEFLRLAAAGALGKIPLVGHGSIPALKNALSDPSPYVSSSAAMSFVSLSRLRLESGDPFVRVDTIRSLGETGSAGIPLLLEILSGNDAYIKPAAAEVLGNIGEASEDVIAGLTEVLLDEEYTLARRALQALNQFGHNAAPALPSLLHLLDSGNRVLIKQSIVTIGSMGPAARSAAPALMPFLESGDIYTRWHTARALLNLGLRPPNAIPVFIEAMKRNEHNVSEQSQESLLLYGEAAIPHLLPLLANKNSDIRGGASMTIGRIGAPPERTFPLLIPMLGDRKMVICIETVKALVENGARSPELAVSFLLPALESTEPRIRFGAAVVLANISPESPEAKKVLFEGAASDKRMIHYLTSLGLLALGEEGIQIAIAGLTDSNTATRLGAVSILRSMGLRAASAIPALIETLRRDVRGVRRKVIQTLRIFGPEARAAVPLLVEGLDDMASYIRKASERTLKVVDPAALAAARSRQ